MSRKRRVGEVVCRCGAYAFPHRALGGKCDGGALVDQTFERNVECRECIAFEPDAFRCQAIDGREKLTVCPVLHEFIRDNEIRLYGVNADPEVEGRKR